MRTSCQASCVHCTARRAVVLRSGNLRAVVSIHIHCNRRWTGLGQWARTQKTHLRTPEAQEAGPRRPSCWLRSRRRYRQRYRRRCKQRLRKHCLLHHLHPPQVICNVGYVHAHAHPGLATLYLYLCVFMI